MGVAAPAQKTTCGVIRPSRAGTDREWFASCIVGGRGRGPGLALRCSRMRGVLKVVAGAILAVGVLLGVAAGAMWLIAPAVGQGVVLDALRDRGFSDAELDVRSMGLRQVAIDDLRLDAPGRLTTETVVATYTPFGLLAGEIDTLRLVGARWVIRVDEGTVDLGPLDRLFDRRDGDGRKRELPVRRIDLRASEVVVVTTTGHWRVPLDGALERTSEGFRVQLSAAPWSQPVVLVADVRQQPALEASFAVTARRGRAGKLHLEGHLAHDSVSIVDLTGQDSSIDVVVAGHRVAVDDLNLTARATVEREPLRVTGLDLRLAAGELQIDERRFDTLTVNAARGAEGIELGAEWAAPSFRGALSLRGLPTHMTRRSWEGARFEGHTSITAWPDADPLTIRASTDARVLRDREGAWSMQMDDGRLELRSQTLVVADPSVVLRNLGVDLAFAGVLDAEQLVLRAPRGGTVRAQHVELGTGDEAHAIGDLRLALTSVGETPLVRVSLIADAPRTISTAARLSGGAASLTSAGARGKLSSFQAEVEGQTVVGEWGLEGRTDIDVRIAPLVHAKSGLRIEQVSASLGLEYPLHPDARGDPGRLRVGPVHWRDSTLPALTGDLVQRGDQLIVALKWPLTGSVAARGRGNLALTGRLSGHLHLTTPPFALEEAEPLVALAETVVGGAITGKVALAGRLLVGDGATTHTLEVQLDDVAVSRPDKLFESVHGVAGTLRFASVVPPTSSGGQRLTWEGGQAASLGLGAGHVDFALEEGGTLLVEEVSTALGKEGEHGRLYVGAFRYSADEPRIRLDLFAESLDLQSWLDLLGRDEIRGDGTLHGHAAATIQLQPTLTVRLGEGVLLAESGGTISLQDEQAAKALLAPTAGASGATTPDLRRVVQERVLEALRCLRYSSLRFELLREGDDVTLQAHVAGRGTRGARQEIGGLTINVNDVEGALNQLLRLRPGAEELESAIPEEVSHDPSAPPP